MRGIVAPLAKRNVRARLFLTTLAGVSTFGPYFLPGEAVAITGFIFSAIWIWEDL